MFTGKELNEFPDGNGGTRRTELKAFAQVICEVAETERTLLVDHYTLWKESMESSCVGDMVLIMGNPQHPNHLGHRRFYHELRPIFNSCENFYYDWERILRDTNK